MTLYDVHTVDAPVRHYQQYQDPILAERMRDHLAEVLHVELVVELVEADDPAETPR